MLVLNRGKEARANWKDTRREKAWNLYSEGISIKNIADRFGVGTGTISSDIRFMRRLHAQRHNC